ncbi:MAG: hypothetical protein AB1428_13390 [Bacteroidota bacterium]
MPVSFAGKALSLFILLSAAPPHSDGQAVVLMSDGVAVQRDSVTVRVHVCADHILRFPAR